MKGFTQRWGTLHVVMLIEALAGPLCPRKCTCDYYASVHTIECDNQDMSRFPPDIPTWTTSVSFDGNFLTILNLSAFNTTIYFERLRIRYNEIVSIQAYNLTSQRRAGRRGGCSEIGKIYPRLVEVNLRGNRIRRLPKCLLSAWPVLKILNLAENQFQSFQDLNFVNHMHYYDSLEDVSLQGNKLTKLKRNDLYSPANALRNVKSIDLSQNRIDRTQPFVFMFLHKLKDIKLNDNLLRVIPNRAFATTGKEVEAIYLQQNRIRKIAAQAFAGLPRLFVLDLSNNHIKCVAPLALSTCPPIPTGGAPPDHDATEVNSLRKLRLSGNRWKCDCNMARLVNTPLNEVMRPPISSLTCHSPKLYRNASLMRTVSSLDCNGSE